MTTFKQFLLTEEDVTKPDNTFCYMIYLNDESKKKLRELQLSLKLNGILKSEDDFHCTIRYVKPTNEKTHDLLVEWLEQHTLPTLKAHTQKFSLFGPESDILVLELDSQELHDWFGKVDNFLVAHDFPKSDFPKYKPHITLAEKIKEPVKFDPYIHRIEVLLNNHIVTNKDKTVVFENQV